MPQVIAQSFKATDTVTGTMTLGSVTGIISRRKG
jgi:hypothetical protein